jgi:penicillin-binding protein 1A
VPPSSPPEPPRPKRPARRFRPLTILVRLAQVACALVALGALGVFFVVRHFEADLPDVHGLRTNYRPAQVTRVLGRDGSLLAEMFTVRRSVVHIDEIPAHVRLAFLAAEDAGFYEHEGLNYFGMLRAFAVNMRAGRTRQGGSTITQQVVKNILLDPERTYRRKMREVLLARRLEQDLTKEDILELYLNHIYLGGGRYGVEEASRYYFGKGIKDVSIAEAALLAALPAGPEHFSPRNDLPRALSRRAFVIEQMERKGFLDAARASAAREEIVRLAPAVEAQPALAPEVVEIVRRTLKETVGDGYTRGGYTVQTTIDPRLQAAARKAVRDNLQALDKRTHAQAPFKAPATGKKAPKPRPEDRPYEGTPKQNEWHRTFVGVVTATHDDAGTIDVRVGDVEGSVKLADFERYNPKGLPPSAFAEQGAILRVSFLSPPPATPPAPGAAAPSRPAGRAPLRLEVGAESALVAISPAGREILALVGSYEGVAGGLDRATQSRRQPGSTFKPILYSYALHSRQATPAKVYDAAPPAMAARNVNVEDATPTSPIRLREAVAKSVNAVAQRVMIEVGPAHVVKWAQQLGITSKLGADISLALGSYEISPLEMTGAYATFAGGGVYQAPRLISRIVGPDGKELPLPAQAAPQRVMDEAEAYLTTSLLTSVVDHGTGARARELGRPLAGKTGTTNQAKDTWFIGYSTDVVCAVWVGYDEPRPLGGGKEAGATAALPAWIGFMKSAHEKRPATDFPRPPGIASMKIDPASGLRPYDGQTDAIEELFLAGTEPFGAAQPDAGAPDDDAGTPEPTLDAGAPGSVVFPVANGDGAVPSAAPGLAPQAPRAEQVSGPAPTQAPPR